MLGLKIAINKWMKHCGAVRRVGTILWWVEVHNAGTKLWKITKMNNDASEEIEVKLLRNDCESVRDLIDFFYIFV